MRACIFGYGVGLESEFQKTRVIEFGSRGSPKNMIYHIFIFNFSTLYNFNKQNKCGPSCGKSMTKWLVDMHSECTIKLINVCPVEPILVQTPLSLCLDCKITGSYKISNRFSFTRCF